MEPFMFIFENLGENKVTHPIETNEFEEGFLTQPQAAPLSAAPPAAPIPNKAPPSKSSSHYQPSFLKTMMLWRNPEISVLSDSRVEEELQKFKTELIKSVAITKTKLSKEVIIEGLAQDRPSYEVMEFLSDIWDVGICSAFGVHGKHLDKPFYKVDTDEKVTETDLEVHRTNYLKDTHKKLNNVKDIKEVFKALQLPLHKVCEETKKKKPLLKQELHSILASYITI